MYVLAKNMHKPCRTVELVYANLYKQSCCFQWKYPSEEGGRARNAYN